MPRKIIEPSGPTLRAQWLGAQMRKLRNERGISLDQAAQYLEIDSSGLARFERAEWPFRREYVLALLDCYNIWDPEFRSRMVQQQEEQWRVDIHDTEVTGTIHDQERVNLTWLEGRAELICVYATMVLPGLLQTPEYAGAVMRYYGYPESAVAEGVRRRMARQQVLTGPKPTKLSTIIEETALRQQVGDPAMMRDQLLHLVTAGRNPNIEIRVMPPAALRPEGSWGQFTLLRFPKLYRSVGYYESIAGRFYFEAPTSKRFVSAYDRLRKAALPPKESAELIAAVAKEWS